LRKCWVRLDNLERPLDALAASCRGLLAVDYLLGDIVNEADVEWGERWLSGGISSAAGPRPIPAIPIPSRAFERRSATP